MVSTFLSRKRFSFGIPVFDRLIQTREMPNSFILYQEQLMKTLQYGGFTGPESYAAIKAISKKHPEKVLPLKERFLKAFSERILEDDKACTEIRAIAMSEQVWKIIDDSTSYSFNLSHAVCVALDSLYGAYAKAHHPLEFYATLLNTFSKKGDKDRVALIKEEMKRGFGIQLAPCRFRQDNRDFYIDHENNTISDALISVKHIGKRVPDALYKMRNVAYDCFTDVLYAMEMDKAFDATAIKILIKMGYFVEYGSVGKLLALYEEFTVGSSRFSKLHVQATQQKRLQELREKERLLPESQLPIYEQVSFEVAHYGAPMTMHPGLQGHYAIIEVDDKYSPKLKLCNLVNGNTGVMKMKKALYSTQPVSCGDVIRLLSWHKKNAYQYIDGKPKPKPGIYDLWIESFS